MESQYGGSTIKFSKDLSTCAEVKFLELRNSE